MLSLPFSSSLPDKRNTLVQALNKEKASFTSSLLIENAQPLFHYLSNAATLCEVDNPLSLFQNLVYEIQSFEIRLKGIYPDAMIKLASYLICISLDELIIDFLKQKQTPEITRLLSHLYQDDQGEKRFFKIIEVLLEKKSTSHELITLAYLCLSLGYRGSYTENSTVPLPYLMDTLYHIIQASPLSHLSPAPSNESVYPLSSSKKNHWLITTMMTTALGLLTCYAFFSFTLDNYSKLIINMH